MAKQLRIALIYDFDGTLSPGNMQEYDFLPQLKIKPQDFWTEANKRAKEQEADNVLSYLTLMLEKAQSNNLKISREDFRKYGNNVKLFDGVDTWFDRINHFAKTLDIVLEHYIISSGIKEMLEGTSIADKFEHIYACSFIYDQNGVAKWPGVAINYTTKTQFLFRINKGLLDLWDDKNINKYLKKSERPIPFDRMIYFGDGETDIPCMKLVKKSGGYSIAVYTPYSSKKVKSTKELLKENRVNFVAQANYQDDKTLDKIVKLILQKMSAENQIKKLEKKLNKTINQDKCFC